MYKSPYKLFTNTPIWAVWSGAWDCYRRIYGNGYNDFAGKKIFTYKYSLQAEFTLSNRFYSDIYSISFLFVFPLHEVNYLLIGILLSVIVYYAYLLMIKDTLALQLKKLLLSIFKQ